MRRFPHRLGAATGLLAIGSFGLVSTAGFAPAASAAPVDASGVALRVELNASAGDPAAVVAAADATVASAYAPPNSSASAVDVAAALNGLVGITATNGTASAAATSTTTLHRGTSRIDGLAAAVLDQPTTAAVLAGTATCPVFGAPSATTTVTDLSVFGRAVTATVNRPTLTLRAATTVSGVADAVVVAAIRTRIQTTTATTATATALLVDLTLTGTVDNAPISVPLGEIAAGTATCVRPALPAPTETGLTPKSGPTTGGTRITVTGTGFDQGGTTVTIGGVTIPAADVTVTSPTSLTFTAPPHTAGPVRVTTTTGGGTSGAQIYTYLPPPTETGLTPGSGPTTGGTRVSVTGTGFVPGATTVTIGGHTIPASGVTVTSPTTLTFTTPPHAAGPVAVTTTTAGGTSPAHTFTYLPVAPTAGGLTPGSGPTSGGTTVTVSGSGFQPGGTGVSVGGVPVPSGDITVNGPTSLTFTTPAHPAGTVSVTVTTPGGTSNGLSFDYLDESATAGLSSTGSSTGGLANTGSTPRVPLALGLLSMLAGAALLMAGRRRAQPRG